MENNWDLIERNDQNLNAKGGSEIMMERIYDGRIPRELLEKFQIVSSRVRELNPNKVRILILNDLVGDPESEHLKNNGWSKWNKIVMVSNWQQQKYIEYYNIPPSKTIVMQNAILPIEEHEKPKDKIRLAYWSTPHRGLEILVPVFEELCKKHDNIELHTHSSFNLYGWGDRDKPYQELFDRMDANPNIFRHEVTSNEELRESLKNYHILAYPNTWLETFCLCLVEAMSAGMLCIHPNYGCLYETAANLTNMYQYSENIQEHAQIFYTVLDQSITNFWSESIQSRLKFQKIYTDAFYNWENRAIQWKFLLESLQNEPTEIIDKSEMFTFRVG